MLVHREITNPELATLLQNLEETELATLIAEGIEELQFDQAVHDVITSPEGTALLERFAAHYQEHYAGSL